MHYVVAHRKEFNREPINEDLGTTSQVIGEIAPTHKCYAQWIPLSDVIRKSVAVTDGQLCHQIDPPRTDVANCSRYLTASISELADPFRRITTTRFQVTNSRTPGTVTIHLVQRG